MSEFTQMATAVDKIITVLKKGGCAYPYANIFDDGSGSLVVQLKEEGKAKILLRQHGVSLRGYSGEPNSKEYHFELELEALNKYKEIRCPHCEQEIVSILHE